MIQVSRLALAALLLAGGAVPALGKDKASAAAAAAVAPGAANPKDLSKAGRAAAAAAQKQDSDGDSAGAIVTIRAAEAAGGLNPTDLFFLSQIKLGAASKAKDSAALEEAVKSSVDSPFLPATEKPKYLKNVAALALQRKDYAAATRAYEQVVGLTPDDSDATLNLALLYGDQKQNAKAADMLEKAIAAKKAKGEKAPEPWYRQRLKIAFDNKLQTAVSSASVALVTDYPNPVNWYDALNLYRDSVNADDQLNLDIYRLMHAANAMGPDREWQEYSRLSLEKGLPGEAKKILDEGIAAKKISGTKPIEKEIAQVAGAKVAADKASLPGLERDAAKATNGRAALATGDAYFGYGNYTKAAEMYRLAANKGAGVDVATANLRLGVALAMAGDKVGATTALRSVQAGQRAQLAQYWLIYVSQKA